ncbi:MAG: hypothetical protein LBN11_02130, partial [Tannerella sp.]|nr:hypothetical protein [Tannerella sp.]
TDERLSVDYVFDSRGRIKSKTERNYGSRRDFQYVYKGEDFLPYQLSTSYGGEWGSTVITETYQYSEIDKQGNWTKCTVKIKTVTEEYDENTGKSTQVSNKTDTQQWIRTITYY